VMGIESVVAAVIVFVLPVWAPKFWSAGYETFLIALLALPLLAVIKQGRWVRGTVLLVCLIWFGFLGPHIQSCPRPTGALENAITQFMAGHDSWVWHAVKVGILAFSCVLFARFYCGWICPKGIIQEYLFQRRLRVRVPRLLDRILKFVKYAVLLALILTPILYGFRLFAAGEENGELGPFRVVFNYWDVLLQLEDDPEVKLSEIVSTTLLAWVGFVLLTSVFIERAYCRYFCPIGALAALLALVSPNRMRIDPESCTLCGRCVPECPVDAILTKKDGSIRIDTMECIACRECESSCRFDSIHFGTK